jgi:glycosyltransferase involved in cell wall biosynthesis
VTGPTLSVVIPSRDGAGRLRTTLASIAEQQGSENVEVVVVDDGSADGTAEAALSWGAARVVRHETARGRGAACNSGVEAARGEVVVLLDDDMTLRPGALETHRSFHAAQPGVAARARVVLAPVEQDSCFRRFLAREEAGEELRLVANRSSLPFALSQTGHFSIRRDALLDAGGFDTSITRYGFEDIELGYRLTERGIRLAYLPEAESIHRAYMTDLNRYLARHVETGVVARQLAERYPEGPFRTYLRVDSPRELGVGRDPAGLVALRVSNRLLLRPWFRRVLGSRGGFAALRGVLRAAEALRFDRAAHFGYHVARDVRYFQGYFGEA